MKARGGWLLAVAGVTAAAALWGARAAAQAAAVEPQGAVSWAWVLGGMSGLLGLAAAALLKIAWGRLDAADARLSVLEHRDGKHSRALGEIETNVDWIKRTLEERLPPPGRRAG